MIPKSIRLYRDAPLRDIVDKLVTEVRHLKATIERFDESHYRAEKHINELYTMMDQRLDAIVRVVDLYNSIKQTEKKRGNK